MSKETSKLRKSPKTANIYINPDLTPAEAAIAFQAREQRRRSAHQTVSGPQVVHGESTVATTKQQASLIQSTKEDSNTPSTKDSHSASPIAGSSFLST